MKGKIKKYVGKDRGFRVVSLAYPYDIDMVARIDKVKGNDAKLISGVYGELGQVSHVPVGAIKHVGKKRYWKE